MVLRLSEAPHFYDKSLNEQPKLLLTNTATIPKTQKSYAKLDVLSGFIKCDIITVRLNYNIW